MDRHVSLIDRAVLPLPKLKRVAAYARVSCGKDEMIQNHPGWEYVGVYSDKAYKGKRHRSLL